MSEDPSVEIRDLDFKTEADKSILDLYTYVHTYGEAFKPTSFYIHSKNRASLAVTTVSGKKLRIDIYKTQLASIMALARQERKEWFTATYDSSLEYGKKMIIACINKPDGVVEAI